jgi:putative peptidoglycan lipid II flippase
VGTSEVWTILRASAPLALGAAVYQVNVLVGGFLAEALLADGGPAALYYATRLQQLPLSLVSVAATSAVFPALTALGHVRDLAGLRKLHDETQLGVAFLAVPATVGLFVFAEPIVALCFRHGAFGDEGVARTTAALRGLTLAILPVGAAGLVARTRYALGDFAGPVRVALAVLLLNTALNVLLVAGLNLDVGALGAAAAAAAWANLAWLLPGLGRLGLPRMGREVIGRLARITTISAAACGVSWLVLELGIGPLRPWIEVVVAILVSSTLYIGLSRAAGAPELARFWTHLRGRAP